MARSAKKTVILVAAGLLFLGGAVVVFQVITRTEKAWRDSSAEVKNRTFPLKAEMRRTDSMLPGELRGSSRRIFDVEFSSGRYHVATSGGVHILDGDFREKKHLTTLNGLAELEVRRMIDAGGVLLSVIPERPICRPDGRGSDQFHSP